MNLENVWMMQTFIPPAILQALTERFIREWVMIGYVTRILTYEGYEPTLNQQTSLKTDEMQNSHLEPTEQTVRPSTFLRHW